MRVDRRESAHLSTLTCPVPLGARHASLPARLGANARNLCSASASAVDGSVRSVAKRTSTFMLSGSGPFPAASLYCERRDSWIAA